MANDSFEAVVVKPNMHGLTQDGKQLAIGVWINSGANAEQLLTEQYDALQGAYDGALEIIHKGGRVFIELKKLFFSREGVNRDARTLADRITRHLGICATVQ